MPVRDEPPAPHLDGDSINALLTATGRGDLGAFGRFYDQTASTVFGLLRAGTNGTNAGATDQATKRVYLALWRAAPRFEAGRRSAYSTVLFTVRRELADQVGAGPAIGPIRPPAVENLL